ncbi:MAG TPA: FtsW/RodA/SpoVE family cell cycle protein [Candidatus Cloacimonadota bacterium]|nr:FtsW/RodA/SpoVE family cell cycle protein [Candidatus Cloacimonadota bacterium]
MKKRNNNRTIIINYDKGILLCYLGLVIIGLLIMLDISSVRDSIAYFIKQLCYSGLSIVTAVGIFYYINMEKLKKWISAFVVITIILLLLVLLFGRHNKGGIRSISLGAFNFQPSVLARVVLIFFWANIIDRKKEDIQSSDYKKVLITLLPLLIVTALIYGLIYMGHHLSSLIINAITIICLLFLSGIRIRYLAISLLIVSLLGVAAIKFGADYRSDRLDIYKKYSLFFPGKDPQITNESNQVRESMIALTSGKLLGTTPSRGRAKHYFLSEARTDYVFTVIGEEFGFLGAIFVFSIYCFLFYRIMLTAFKQTDFYLQILAIGLGLNIFLNVLVHIGVSMSILPSTGTTLPFISYGGTALLIDSATIGLLLNISATRKML